MQSNFKTQLAKHLFLGMIVLAFSGCENDPNDFEPAAYSRNPEVFIDTFSPGLLYSSYGGAVANAFQVDNEVAYNNSAASMRFDVPNVNNPLGSYAGGSF